MLCLIAFFSTTKFWQDTEIRDTQGLCRQRRELKLRLRASSQLEEELGMKLYVKARPFEARLSNLNFLHEASG